MQVRPGDFLKLLEMVLMCGQAREPLREREIEIERQRVRDRDRDREKKTERERQREKLI